MNTYKVQVEVINPNGVFETEVRVSGESELMARINAKKHFSGTIRETSDILFKKVEMVDN